MSESNVDVVRAHIDAYRRDDVAGALARLDPDVVVDTTRVSGAAGAVSHGHEGLVREVRRFMGAFDDYAYDVEHMTDLGGGTVAVVVTERGRGKGSGIPVERTFAGLYTVVAGKIIRITAFSTEREALEAAGLRE